MGETSLLNDAEIGEALDRPGARRPPEPGDKSLADSVPALWNIWNLAIDLDFLQPEGEDTVSADADTADWPFEEDDDALDAWMAGLHSIDYGDPELDDEEATIALSGLTRALLIRLLLATGSKPLAELRHRAGRGRRRIRRPGRRRLGGGRRAVRRPAQPGARLADRLRHDRGRARSGTA